MTKISIITVNLNNKDGLRKTIESVVNQTYKDIEYIVIDGGSTDGSVDVIKEYADKVNYWVSEPDKGIYNAMNKGIVKATGEYLHFLNSGDWLCDEKVIENVKSKLRNRKDIYTGNLICCYNNYNRRRVSPDFIDITYIYDKTLNHVASFFKYELFQKFGLYDEQFKISGDFDLFFRFILIKNASYERIDIDIVYYDTNGISSDPKNLKQSELEHQYTKSKYLSQPIINLIEEYIYNFPVIKKWYINIIIELFQKLRKLKSKIKSITIKKILKAK